MFKIPIIAVAIVMVALRPGALSATPAIMEEHCSACHNDDKEKGKFNLRFLGEQPSEDNLDYWLDSLDMVSGEEMPPEEDSELTAEDRKALVAYLQQQLNDFDKSTELTATTKPRRLNNREFVNSVRDVLLIEDVGTHFPTANLVGDARLHGFDTDADTLGFSYFHLEQYISAVRKVLDAVILPVERPETKRYIISADGIIRSSLRQNTNRRPTPSLEKGVFDFLDPRLHAYFDEFKEVPTTGNYRIRIRATGKDRAVYDTKYTGLRADDPIRLAVHLGDRISTFDLPDEDVLEIELNEWLAEGTRLELHYPTDGLTKRGNGNFKFQYAIAASHLKENDPVSYARRVKQIKNASKGYRGKNANRSRTANVDRWQNWVSQWQGPRPRLFGVEIEGPFYESWPPQRQVALLGEEPSLKNAAQILAPIAERAWRRPLRTGELDRITNLVAAKAQTMDDVSALKEGIVSILVSPSFLLLNTGDLSDAERFASKLSYFLTSSSPESGLVEAVNRGDLDDFEHVRSRIQSGFENRKFEEFLNAFPTAWLELNDINFMSPDPAEYPFYNRKRLSEDMIAEVLMFFRHIVENNLPITDFLSADYSFVNADLAELYGIRGAPEDSILRKHTFQDGRRGGLLGMGAFLTSTADSLSTSPIHRAVYVMENFMGIHPSAPPADIEITEPDVRQAKTIKEILAAHMTEESCAICHENIDPYGYAFENFDPTGAWRDAYVVPDPTAPLEAEVTGNSDGSSKKRRKSVSKVDTIPVDPSSRFINGSEYSDIRGFRKLIVGRANKDRFIRCFITKLLTYANGTEPSGRQFAELGRILAKSKQNDYRIVDTIAAVVDSPLFRSGGK